MTAVVQRVLEASVCVEAIEYSKIGKGLLVLLGVCTGDDEDKIKAAALKILDLRIFQDEDQKMNLSVRDIGGEVMVVSQFTLCSDKGKSGNRPSFINAEKPGSANLLYELMITEMKNSYDKEKIKTGKFAADMKVKLTNDGPVTIILEK
ncbi:MAG: D-aminoacyl-tRNA deacylase [bacterium]|nr:D-aminoacyl-tRNA deacylase [bacterium]